jgi:hypothetical protein
MARKLELMALSAALFVVLPTLASAAIWPDDLGAFHRASAQSVSFQKPEIPDEYGFQEGEEAHYEGAGEKFTATAWRFQDPTGGMAAFYWLRMDDAKPSGIARMAVDWPNGSLVLHANYVLKFVGYHPAAPFLTTVIENLKQVDASPLPALIDDLPAENLIPNSERYIEGPAALAEFYPGVPPATAAFHYGAEAIAGTFAAPGAPLKLAIFNYPTPQIAMQEAVAFQKIPAAMVKRSGPLVAVILAPANADAAEKLLSLVRYQAQITLDQHVSTRRDNIGDLVINAFILIGVLLAFFVIGGLAVGGVRAFLRHGSKDPAAEAMIVLHLHDR